jgi:hypothetical protein
LISRLSSRITKKYGAGGRILFYNSYFPKEKPLITIIFINNRDEHVFLVFLTGYKVSNKNTGVGHQNFAEKRHFYKIKNIGVGQFLKDG